MLGAIWTGYSSGWGLLRDRGQRTLLSRVEDPARAMPPDRPPAGSSHRHGLRFHVEYRRSVLVDSENLHRLRQHHLQSPQAAFSHVAVARVVRPAFVVVKMRDHRQLESQRREDVQTIEPGRLCTNLVDFVYGKGKLAEAYSRR